jgi:hypothetical protein
MQFEETNAGKFTKEDMQKLLRVGKEAYVRMKRS